MSRRLKLGKIFLYKTEAIEKLEGKIEKYLRQFHLFFKKNTFNFGDKNHQILLNQGA